MPSDPPSACRSPCKGAPPSCVTMLTTPATAFEPYSDEAEPRSTSMWSGATILKVDMKELESPCVVVASRNRRPSTSTAAASVRRPRIRMLVFCPGPPPLVTTTPGTVRKRIAQRILVAVSNLLLGDRADRLRNFVQLLRRSGGGHHDRITDARDLQHDLGSDIAALQFDVPGGALKALLIDLQQETTGCQALKGEAAVRVGGGANRGAGILPEQPDLSFRHGLPLRVFHRHHAKLHSRLRE